jgi:hypothetical protein
MMPVEWERLVRHLRDNQEKLSISKLYYLSDLRAEELTHLKATWPTIPPERRRQIVSHLVDITETTFEVDFSTIFRFCLHDEEEEVRACAIEGLWEEEDASLIGPLVHLLQADPSGRVRATAATALGHFVLLGELEKIEAALATFVEEALLQTIHSQEEDLEVRRRAIESIAYSGELGVRDIIEAAYYDEEEKMQVSAIFAMGRSADPIWRDMVITELDNPNPEIRLEAARACGELEARAAVSKLAQLLEDDPDSEVQQAAIWALGHIGGAKARQVLEACFNGDNEVLRMAAGEALDEMNLSGDVISIPLFADEEDYDWEDEDEL